MIVKKNCRLRCISTESSLAALCVSVYTAFNHAPGNLPCCLLPFASRVGALEHAHLHHNHRHQQATLPTVPLATTPWTMMTMRLSKNKQKGTGPHHRPPAAMPLASPRSWRVKGRYRRAQRLRVPAPMVIRRRQRPVHRDTVRLGSIRGRGVGSKVNPLITKPSKLCLWKRYSVPSVEPGTFGTRQHAFDMLDDEGK